MTLTWVEGLLKFFSIKFLDDLVSVTTISAFLKRLNSKDLKNLYLKIIKNKNDERQDINNITEENETIVEDVKKSTQKDLPFNTKSAENKYKYKYK